MSDILSCEKCRSVDLRLTGYYTGDGWVQLICFRCDHLQWKKIGIVPRDGEKISPSFSAVLDNPSLATKRPEYPLYVPLQSLHTPKKAEAKPQEIFVNTSRSGRDGAKKDDRYSIIDHIFLNVIKKTLPGYVDRPVQRELAKKIWKTRMSSGILVAEAGVGTGKSFAYLVPAIQKVVSAGLGPVVISTKTIALQEQLYKRDIPFILGATGTAKNVFLAKGKTNYICLNRLNEEIKANPKSKELALLEKWVEKMRHSYDHAGYGDKSLGPEVSEQTWDKVCVKRCQESRCKLFSVCGYMLYRQQRRRADDIIIVNHDLLVADLKARKRNKMLWSTPGMYVIDEAHALESSAQRQLSYTVNYGKLASVLEQAVRRRETKSLVSLEATRNALDSLDDFFKTLRRSLDPDRGSEIIHASPKAVKSAKRLAAVLEKLYEGIQVALAGFGQSVRGEFIEEAAEHIEEALNALDIFCRDLKEYVFYLEGKLEFIASPLNVGNYLKEELWNGRSPVVLVSGTLAVQKKLDYFCYRIGLNGLKPPRKVEHFIGLSPFDYKNRVRIYVPEHLPRPSHDDEKDEKFITAMAEEIDRLVKITDGRALVLFTSYRRMNAVYELLSKRTLPGRLLCQGRNYPSYKLLEIFRNDVNSILLATGTFWEGIDAAGETLTLVVMDKLPFP
ncbi:MAG: ATP-dependent DNA helicase, partial [Desulfotomaculales bacterium]